MKCHLKLPINNETACGLIAVNNQFGYFHYRNHNNPKEELKALFHTEFKQFVTCKNCKRTYNIK